MQIDHDHILGAFRKLIRVNGDARLDCINANRIPVSVDDVLSVIQETTGYTIAINSVQYDGPHTRGLIEINEKAKTAAIYIRASLTQFEQRFATIKEASTLIVMCGPQDCNPYGQETIAAMVADAYASAAGNHTAPERSVQSDAMAEYIALEIMYPYEKRLLDEQTVKKGATTLAALANQWHLPHYIIGLGLSDPYMKISGQLWADLELERKHARKPSVVGG